MNRMLFLVSLTAMLVTAVDPAGAAVFERDWQTPGDGLLTYDDVNRREWLDLPVSLMSQFAGTTLEARFQNSLEELQPGGLFDGFTLAASADLLDFAESAEIDTTTRDYSTNHFPTTELLDLLGRTRQGINGSSTTGLLSDVVAPPPEVCPCPLVSVIGDGWAGEYVAGLRFLSSAEIGNDDRGISFTGLYLYRQVPESISVFAAVIAFCLLDCLGFLRLRFSNDRSIRRLP